MKKIISVLAITLFTLNYTNAQHVMGTVVEKDKDGKEIPIVGANVFFPGTNIGTVTDVMGMFHLHPPDASATSIVITYVGYVSDTVPVIGEDIKVVLQKSVTLNEVVVSGTKSDSHISSINPLKTEVLSGGELRKNACCNLAESFESNPTVDVSFTDAVTGAKKFSCLACPGFMCKR